MKKHFNFIKNRIWWYSLSGLMVLASIVVLAWHGLEYGIDFTGGSVMNVKIKNIQATAQEIAEKASTAGFGQITVQSSSDDVYIFKSRQLSPVDEEVVINTIKGAYANSELSIESTSAIGPIIGQELRQKAILSIIVVFMAIIIFVSFAFRKVSKPVKSWKYGLIAIIALLHDVIITTGAFAILGIFFGAEVDTLFITALLTVLGFSVHDTIVVFDRIRENIKLQQGASYESIVDYSVNQTLGRSISTSATALIVLASIIVFGGDSIRWFVSTLFIGIFVGTYSSIFIASPLLVDWYKRQKLD